MKNVNMSRMVASMAVMSLLVCPAQTYDHGYLAIKDKSDKDWLQRQAKRKYSKKARRRNKNEKF